LLLPLVNAIQLAGFILTLVVLIDVVLSFFMSPFHPLRRTLDSLVDPMLAPVRRVVQPAGSHHLDPDRRGDSGPVAAGHCLTGRVNAQVQAA
jgi:uncharacterized protein YggT (Ycf19 family)